MNATIDRDSLLLLVQFSKSIARSQGEMVGIVNGSDGKGGSYRAGEECRLAIPHEHTSSIKAEDGPSGRIEFQDSAQIQGRMGFAGRGQSACASVTETQYPRARFEKYSNLTFSNAGLHASKNGKRCPAILCGYPSHRGVCGIVTSGCFQSQAWREVIGKSTAQAGVQLICQPILKKRGAFNAKLASREILGRQARLQAH